MSDNHSHGQEPEAGPHARGTAEAADLRERGIDEQKAAELRDRLATFAEDWNSPAMEVYDDYDAAKSKL